AAAPDTTAPAAVGFTVEVDAIKLILRPPDYNTLLATAAQPHLLPGLRTSFFKHLVATTAALDGFANVFQRAALALVVPSMLSCRSQQAACPLPGAWQHLQASDFRDPAVESVLRSLASPLSLYGS